MPPTSILHPRTPMVAIRGNGISSSLVKAPGRVVKARFDTRDSREAPFTIDDVTLRTGLVDYYKLLDLEKTASFREIKAAYRQMQKRCHPDILGDERGHRMSIMLNDAYTVLSSETTRELYDIDLHCSRLEEELGFTNKAFSEWVPETDPPAAKNPTVGESRALFVDEATCIGCKQCCWAAENTFYIEPQWGRARVTKQWADNEEALSVAAESCPVRCIHWVKRDDLPVLEHVMKHATRIDVGIMQSTACRRGAQVDVFAQAERFRMKKRERRQARKSWTEAFMYSREQEAAMRRAATAASFRSSDGAGSLEHIIMWLRDHMWRWFGYGMDRQPATGPADPEPRAWKPPSDGGGALDSEAAKTAADERPDDNGHAGREQGMHDREATPAGRQ